MLIPDALSTALRDARHLVVFTGAGVSAESGIPTFRDALSGLWERFDPAELATPSAFRRDPALVWGWYESRRAQVLTCEPNAAHRAIAALTYRVPRLTLVTQNVDGLHQRAGSPDVLSSGSARYCPPASGMPPRLPLGTAIWSWLRGPPRWSIQPPSCP